MHKLQSASAKHPVVPTDITKLLPTTVLRMAIMGPSGSEEAASSSAPALGTTDRTISTAHVDHHLDYRKGYHGAMPARGAAPAEHRAEFHGQAMHDAHGKEAPRKHK
jgi:hypothetical protein